MPRIDIREVDLTQSSGTLGTDIPFIPGFSSCDIKYRPIRSGETATHVASGTGFVAVAEGVTGTHIEDLSCPEIPTLCTSIRDFEHYFGSSLPKFNKAFTELSVEANSYDRSYLMAKELLSRGMPIYYYVPVRSKLDTHTGENASHILKEFYTKLKTYLTHSDSTSSDLADKGEYDIKYITSGGYPNFHRGSDGKASTYDLSEAMTTVAAARGDCVALIEEVPGASTTLTGIGSFFNSLSNFTTTNDEYAAAFTPWATYSPNIKYPAAANITDLYMPACFGYLADLALNIKTCPNWLAMAGITRGLVPNIKALDTCSRLSNVIADTYQPTAQVGSTTTRALNAITDIKPYGLCIWGNRTLETVVGDGLKATNFLNIRNMISDIKKVAYKAAKSCLFEQNSEVLWLNYKAKVTPYLEQLKSGNGISNYKIFKLDTKYDGSTLKKEEFACAIKVYPLYAVEAFDITIELLDNDVNINS